ncbi:MAG: S1C family serine protease [Terriglobia bacterium]
MGNSNVLEDFSAAAAIAVERASRSVVAVDARRHMLAAGVHWREGVIVTANHAVRREDDIKVLLPDARTATASLAGRDPSTDIAVLRVESKGQAIPEVGDPASLKAGHLVLAVGRVEAGPRASLGVIGVSGGSWRTWQGGQINQLIRLGFELHPTLSGGLVVDPQGRGLGICTTRLSRTFGVAIPVSTVNRVVDLLLQKGGVPKGYLGVGLWPVSIPEDSQAKLSLEQPAGLMVQHVETNGPASLAGILMGDVIVRLNDRPVTSIQGLHLLLSEFADATVRIVVIRAGSLADLSIRVGERLR